MTKLREVIARSPECFRGDVAILSKKFPSYLLWLIFFTLSIRLVFNFLFFKAYGPLSSSGADLWFFIGVAKGYYSLFWGDPLQWIFPIFHSLSPETLFYLFLVFSNALHLATVLLLFYLLRSIYQNEQAAFWSSIIYSCTSSSFLFTTGSFIHQGVALPLMVGIIWGSYRSFCDESKRNHLILAFLFLMVGIGLSIGPDVAVLIAAMVPGMLAQKLRGLTSFRKWVVMSVLMVAYGALILGAGKTLTPVMEKLATNVRGIDLLAQRALYIGDLMPLTWERFLGTYSWLGFIWLGVLCFAWLRNRFWEVGLVVVSLLISIHAVRFFFIAELGTVFLICWLFVTIFSKTFIRNLVGGFIVVFLIGTEIVRGFICFCPSTLVSVIQQMKGKVAPRSGFKTMSAYHSFETTSKHFVFCNPSLGFVVRALTGVEPTADMHHLQDNDRWMHMILLPAEEAIAQFKKGGVDYLLLTSHDFQATSRVEGGEIHSGWYASGGLASLIDKLSPDELQRSLLYQSFTPLFQSFPVSGIHLVDARLDPVAKLVILLYQLTNTMEQKQWTE